MRRLSLTVWIFIGMAAGIGIGVASPDLARHLGVEELGISSFLEQVALVSDQDTLEASANVPTLLTLHAAKGLEFPVVFIVGLNAGTLPQSRSFEDPEAMMEERRLLYVGIWRAMDLLYLVYSQNRSSFGYAEPAEPSRFLRDLPTSLLNTTQPPRTRRSSLVEDRSDRWETQGAAALSQEKVANAMRFHAGMRVLHPVWGEGMVLNSRLQDGDEVVDVFFSELGLKRVVASVARLEIKG